MNANSTAVAVNMSDVAQAHSASVDAKAALERELMQRVLAGETNLFYDLIRPYERAVFLAATSILRNEADGEEDGGIELLDDRIAAGEERAGEVQRERGIGVEVVPLDEVAD